MHACADCGVESGSLTWTISRFSPCAHVRTHTIPFSTYQPTDLPHLPPDLLSVPGSSILSSEQRTVVARAQIREQLPASSLSGGQTGRIFAFNPLPFSFTTSLPSYLILLQEIQDILPLYGEEKKIAGTWIYSDKTLMK